MRALDIAATGMAAQQLNVETVSNNIANMNTVGYKKQRPEFEDLLSDTMRTAQAPNPNSGNQPVGLQVGLGVRPVATARDFTQGGLQQTGNTYDLAISGNGFFQVTMPDGTTGYTRDGSFTVDAAGQLVTHNGYTVQR